jgi:hypothetical protein
MALTTSKRRRRWLWTAAFAVVLLIAAWVAKPIPCAFVWAFLGTSQTRFDSAAWKGNWTWRCTPIRRQMADDLVASRLLLGQTSEQAAELLGPADREPYLLQEQPGWAGAMIYKLGPNVADWDWLVVVVDKGRVTDAQIVSD